MRHKGHAVVVGGGIGGLAVAGALDRSGWRVTLLERQPTIGAAGAGLLLAANAVHALRALGLGGRVARIGTPVASVGFRRPDGSWLSRIDPARVAARLGAPTLAVARPALHALLLDALGPTVDVRTGTEVRVLPDADLVVGADGIGSAIRGLLAPRSLLLDTGHVAWRALVPAGRAPTGATFGETLGAGLRFGCAPLGPDGVYWYATAPGPARSTPPAAQLRELADRFAGWHAPVGDLIAATDPADLLHHPLAGIRVVPPMAVGSVALVGDAAHPMTPNLGQGACLALEDAVTLAALLGTDDVAPALARYDRERRPRAARIVRRSRSAGRFLQAGSPLGTRLRDLALTATPARFAESGAVALAGWTPPTLPEGKVLP
ncbi:FAD-dependent monooxygenase [Longispora sp. NPDC051575]|uniref:FAD-dependent monooxygenase n=1 Tax=Longispora sp. NPDC051575 TaxID=3154943 RepID=UPI00342D0877